MDAFIPGGPRKGVVRWQMDVKTEDWNRGNNLVCGANKAFSCRKERCGNYRDRKRDATWSPLNLIAVISLPGTVLTPRAHGKMSAHFTGNISTRRYGAGVGIFKVSSISHFLHRVQPISHKSTSEHSLHTMRFTSNAFIVSTVALLSLMTPVVNAQYVATIMITSPAGRATLYALQSYQVTWFAVKREDPSAVWDHRSLTAGITAGPSTTPRVCPMLHTTPSTGRR
jgi:hypothetical protein